MFDEPIKLNATAASDDHDFSDEIDDDKHLFDDDDEEEEEVTMTSDDDDDDADGDEVEDDAFASKHAEDATVFALPPSPVAPYSPPDTESELPVKSEATPVVAAPSKPAAKKAPLKKAAAKKA